MAMAETSLSIRFARYLGWRESVSTVPAAPIFDTVVPLDRHRFSQGRFGSRGGLCVPVHSRYDRRDCAQGATLDRGASCVRAGRR